MGLRDMLSGFQSSSRACPMQANRLGHICPTDFSNRLVERYGASSDIIISSCIGSDIMEVVNLICCRSMNAVLPYGGAILPSPMMVLNSSGTRRTDVFLCSCITKGKGDMKVFFRQ